MNEKILLIGSTDLTFRLAEYLETKNALAGVINTASTLKSQSGKVHKNARYQDMEKWCQKKRISFRHLHDQQDIIHASQELGCSVALLAGVHILIKKDVIQSFPLGVYALHASLLPKMKGWSPLNWAILTGVQKTGLTLFRVDGGMDTGPIAYQEKFTLTLDDYIADAIEKVSLAAENIMEYFIADIQADSIPAKQQTLQDSSFCLQRVEEDSLIRWGNTNQEIMSLIRASSSPYPGAYTYLNGQKVSIFRASPSNMTVVGRPGQIFRFSKDMPFHVMCGSGCLTLEDLAIENETNWKEFLEKNINETFSY